jgi:hypothetical protein
MSPRRSYARKSDIARAIEAVKACGMDVAGVRLSPDGSMELLDRAAIPKPQNDFDRFEDQL